MASDEPVPPRQLNAQVPRDLETICLKCLRKEPGKRYASAEQLAYDLNRFQRDEPILARPIGPVERASKWIRRNPVVTALLAAVILSLTAGATISYLKYRDANFQRQRAEDNEQKAKDQERLTGAALAEVETTLLDGLLLPIGQKPNEALDAIERDALRQLAGLSSERTRLRFLEKGLATPDGIARLANRADPVIHAVVGLDREQKRRAEQVLLDQLKRQTDPRIRGHILDLALALPIDDANARRQGAA